ncbi:hypothetical protein ACLB2K_002392 [Fragaria x ananassa]
MAEEVIVLGFWSSMFAMRPRVALAKKGVEYEYREEALPNKTSLLQERAQARFLVDNIDKMYMKLGRGYGPQREKNKKQPLEILKVLERELGDKTYFGGESFG